MPNFKLRKLRIETEHFIVENYQKVSKKHKQKQRNIFLK